MGLSFISFPIVIFSAEHTYIQYFFLQGRPMYSSGLLVAYNDYLCIQHKIKMSLEIVTFGDNNCGTLRVSRPCFSLTPFGDDKMMALQASSNYADQLPKEASHHSTLLFRDSVPFTNQYPIMQVFLFSLDETIKSMARVAH